MTLGGQQLEENMSHIIARIMLLMVKRCCALQHPWGRLWHTVCFVYICRPGTFRANTPTHWNTTTISQANAPTDTQMITSYVALTHVTIKSVNCYTWIKSLTKDVTIHLRDITAASGALSTGTLRIETKILGLANDAWRIRYICRQQDIKKAWETRCR